MFDLQTLSRPVRRILAEWVGKLIDRLLRFKSQLHDGLIRMLSSSIAETVEDQFYKSKPAERYQYDYDDGYFDEYYQDQSSGPSSPSSQLDIVKGTKSSDQQHAAPSLEGWNGVFKQAAQILMKWVRGPWAEPILASAVTLVSLLLLVR